jgi:hypothetical protein
MLWYNETNYNKSAGLYKFAGKACKIVENSDSPKPELNGQLIHVSGVLHSPKALEDKDFGLVAHDSLRLSRTV